MPGGENEKSGKGKSDWGLAGSEWDGPLISEKTTGV